MQIWFFKHPYRIMKYGMSCHNMSGRSVYSYINILARNARNQQNIIRLPSYSTSCLLLSGLLSRMNWIVCQATIQIYFTPSWNADGGAFWKLFTFLVLTMVRYSGCLATCVSFDRFESFLQFWPLLIVNNNNFCAFPRSRTRITCWVKWLKWTFPPKCFLILPRYVFVCEIHSVVCWRQPSLFF